eukprot:Pgem_evm1s18960
MNIILISDLLCFVCYSPPSTYPPPTKTPTVKPRKCVSNILRQKQEEGLTSASRRIMNIVLIRNLLCFVCYSPPSTYPPTTKTPTVKSRKRVSSISRQKQEEGLTIGHLHHQE